ncbi:hypothetical protein K450DRAFT_195937 [Umbelopsis ramanniana AG]|uniref:Uncharacterized protein n=1 Tax=Umbelopsis ramanniana AG TaxID=1314678 RepID=A0AAD5EHR8_UMBRA|nr:uncharacterized protein K450DRAFT_195937 [Umbelopsis ramanniana AG]KAI8583657.1 hypothetical protein K450DRAFT_195937 [Umbelopsis ramanniana AG]
MFFNKALPLPAYMRIFTYIVALAVTGALVQAAPTSYGDSTHSISQELDSLFNYAVSRNKYVYPLRQQLQADLAKIQSTSDHSSSEYKAEMADFRNKLGIIYTDFPLWPGWNDLFDEIYQGDWDTTTAHSNDGNTDNYESNSTSNQFEQYVEDLETYVKQYDIGSLGDVLIVKQAIIWLDQNEHNIATVHDFNDQVSGLDEAWGRLHRNNAAWPKWEVAESTFKNMYSDALKDVPKSDLTHLYAEENSHTNSVQYEDLDSFFYNPNQHNDEVNVSDDIDQELNAIFAAFTKVKTLPHIDGLLELVENINHNDAI